MLRFLNFIHHLPIFWSVTGLFLVHGGDKILVALVAVSITLKLISTILKKDHIHLNINALVVIIALSSIYASLSYYHNGYSSSEIRVLLSTLLYALISMPKKENSNLILISILFGASIISFYTIDFLAINSATRYQLPLNAIPYSNFLGLLSIGFIYLIYINKNTFLRSCLLFLLSLLFASILLIDTRGTWLALVVSFVALAAYLLYKKIDMKVFSIVFITTCILGLSSYPIVKDRIDSSLNEIRLISNGDLNSSWGIRIQLWRIGFEIIENNPSMIGLGQTAHLSIIKKMHSEGKVSNTIAHFDNKNFHNSFIDRTVKYGFIGLFLFLATLFIPFYYGVKNIKDPQSLYLIISPIFIFVAGLTYVPLSHPGTYFLYLFSNVFLINQVISMSKSKG